MRSGYFVLTSCFSEFVSETNSVTTAVATLRVSTTCVYGLVVTYHTTHTHYTIHTHTASVSSAYNTSSVVDTEAASGDPSVAVVSAFYLLSLQTCTCWDFIPAPSAKDLTLVNITFAVLLSVFIKS